MGGNQSREIGTDLTEFDRRSFLRVSVGTGIASTVGLTGSVAAQDTSGGDGIWKFETDGWVESSPTVINGITYFGSRDTKLYAVSADDGTEQWQFDAEDFVLASPNIVDNIVFVGCGGGNADDFNNLYALNADDGTEQWRFEADGYVLSSPTVIDGSVYFGTTGGTIYSLDAQSGNKNWEVTDDFGRDVNTSPTVADGTVFIGGHGDAMYGLDAGDGSEIWSFETTGPMYGSSPTVVDNTVVFGDGDGFVYAIDSDDGTKQWEFTTGDSVTSSPTVADGIVYCGSDDGYVYAIDSSEGTEIWNFETGDGVSSSPTAAGEVVFVGSEDNYLYALDASDGTEQWRFETDRNVESSPTVVNGVVYFGSDDGYLYAIDAGIEGSSEGSRVRLGTLGHHHEWGGETKGQQTGDAGAIFRQFYNPGEFSFLSLVLGAGSVGLGYTAYRRWYTNDTSIEHRSSSDRDLSDSSGEIDQTISEYDDIRIKKTIRESPDYLLQQGKIEDHHFWILKPSLEDAETVSTAVFEAFSESVDPWTGMDSHPYLVGVLGTGSEPIPWVAIEDADDPTLVDHVDTLSTAETIEALQEVCEALHHVHRYGTAYGNLTTDSVLYTNDGGVKLRGILDQFGELDPWYNAPEEFNGESTERSTVYRVGLIAYELLTGTLPYSTYPNGDPESDIQSHELISPSEQVATLPEDVDEILLTALSVAPADRYETVLHLRDELSRI